MPNFKCENMKPSKKKNPLVVIPLGKPGSGKGTQAKLLAEKFALEYIGIGDILRKRRKIRDFTGKKLWKIMTSGDLVPQVRIVKVWIDEFEKMKNNPRSRGFVLDGSPRWLIEAKLLDEALGWYEWEKNAKIILIDISRKEAFNRLTKRRICKKCGRLIPWVGEFKKIKRCDKCGSELITRLDDKPESIKQRFEEFRENTQPAVNYYRKQKRLIEINGEQSIEDVFKDILKALK